jgi:hypothetical protein
MSRDEWNKSGFEEGVSWQGIVRNVLKDYELETGKKLEWVAAEHQNIKNPHTHILIKATYKDRDGVSHKLHLNKNNIKNLSNRFQKEIDRTRGFHIEPPDRAKQLQMKKQLASKGMGIGEEFAKNLIIQLQRKYREEQLKREYERER